MYSFSLLNFVEWTFTATKFGIQIVTPEQMGMPQEQVSPEGTIMMDNREENN